jgi:hypothetical protein
VRTACYTAAHDLTQGYRSANLVHKGICYCGTYCLDSKNPHLGVDVLGLFVGFRDAAHLGGGFSFSLQEMTFIVWT